MAKQLLSMAVAIIFLSVVLGWWVSLLVVFVGLLVLFSPSPNKNKGKSEREVLEQKFKEIRTKHGI